MELSAFMQHFGIGPNFLAALALGEDFSRGLARARDPADLANAFGAGWKQLSYTLGTNQRGRKLLQRIQRALPYGLPASGRALDIGCGYGGTLVGFHEHGLEPSGIDLDPRLTRISQANVSDQGCRANIETIDAFRHLEARGPYELIVLNDVIEHLIDPARAIALAAKALSPGGVLAIYAPNGKHPAYATKDPHNGVFGASALPRALAMPLVKAALNATNYGLGEYPSLEWLSGQYAENDLTVFVDPTDYGETLASLPQLMSEFFAAWQSTPHIAALPDPILQREITMALFSYVGDVCNGASRALQEGRQAAFTRTFLRRAWLVLGVKP
jgi:SAM-dependent methyltransferase